MPRKKIIVASPDANMRCHLKNLVHSSPEFDVIGCTGDLMSTYALVEELLPNAVLIADVLASLPEFEVMRGLFSTLDIRWLVLTSLNRPMASFDMATETADLFAVAAFADETVILRQLKGLTRTATSRLQPAQQATDNAPEATPAPVKPENDTTLSKINDCALRPSSEMRTQVNECTVDQARAPLPHDPRSTQRRILPVATRKKVSDRPLEGAPDVANTQLESPGTATRHGLSSASSKIVQPKATAETLDSADRVIVIGSSTGGVDALLSVLSSFPALCPPTFIVQHTGSGFGESLARLLDRQCKASVRLARRDTPVRPGEVVIGAGTKSHLVIGAPGKLWGTLQAGSAVSGHLPSVDMLFRSAVAWGDRVTAVLLTGMGRDGADGMLALRQAGARTIAQDKGSSVVWGMPRAAMENGGAQTILPLDQIGPALFSQKRPEISGRREMHQ